MRAGAPFQQKDETVKTDINNLCFIDSETRRIPDATIEDVTKVGAYRYATQAFATMWTWVIGDDPDWSVMALHDGFDERLTWDYDAPDRLKAFHERVLRGEAWYVIWNAAFDRQIWTGPQSDFPRLLPEMTLDAMAQAVASGVPAKLSAAAKFCGGTQKLEQGSHLIKLFEPPHGATPESRPEDWEDFVEYGGVDVLAMRDIWKMTRPLSLPEWETYWASERINDRGMHADLRLCAAASVLVDDAKAIIGAALKGLTDGDVDKVTQAARILRWLEERMTSAEMRDILTDKKELLHDDGTVKRPEKLSLAKARVELAVAYLKNIKQPTNNDSVMLAVLEHRLFGGSTTPSKFASILRMQVGGSLQGQYVMNGAGQTGRFSSRGVQIHNLMRDHLGEDEEAAIEYITGLVDERIGKRLEEATCPKN